MLKIEAIYRLKDGKDILIETCADLENAEEVALAVRQIFQAKYSQTTKGWTQLPLPFRCAIF